MQAVGIKVIESEVENVFSYCFLLDIRRIVIRYRAKIQSIFKYGIRIAGHFLIKASRNLKSWFFLFILGRIFLISGINRLNSIIRLVKYPISLHCEYLTT